MGKVYGDKKEYDKAIECYKKAIELDANYVHAWNNMGSDYWYKEEYDRAIECYEKALEIDANYVYAWYGMGLTYSDKKEYNKADECFKNILNINPEYKKIIRKTILNLGVKYNRLNISEITEKCLIEEQNIIYLMRINLLFFLVKKNNFVYGI